MEKMDLRKKALLHEAKLKKLAQKGVSKQMIHQRNDLKHESIKEREAISRLSKYSKKPKSTNKDFFEVHKEKEKNKVLEERKKEEEKRLRKSYGIA